MNNSKSYFGSTIFLILLSIGAFLCFKEVFPQRLFPELTVEGDNIIIDNLLLEAIAEDKSKADTPLMAENMLADSIANNPKEIEKEGVIVNDPVLSAGGYVNLRHFYSELYKLESSKKGRVRIAYFGDSMTDGDLIVQDVRQEFQETYGGRGVGFVAITSLSAGSRYSVSHQFSKNWRAQSYIAIKKPLAPFGIDGQVFFADTTQTSWVKYKAQGIKHSTQLNNPTLFYGKSNNENAYISIEADDAEAVAEVLSPTRLLNTKKISASALKSLKVSFHKADSIPIYGFNFDNGQGVHIDNFSLRGNSGLPLSVLNNSLMNVFDRTFNYDLIILQYGANVLSQTVESYGWYERGMTNVINNLRRCFPNADILVISTADKATKIEADMETDQAVELLLKSQRNYARKTNSGFINLYSLMGGNGSMITWVDENLAGKDYTHFNAQGAKKVAKLISGEMKKGYELYKKDVANGVLSIEDDSADSTSQE